MKKKILLIYCCFNFCLCFCSYLYFIFMLLGFFLIQFYFYFIFFFLVYQMYTFFTALWGKLPQRAFVCIKKLGSFFLQKRLFDINFNLTTLLEITHENLFFGKNLFLIEHLLPKYSFIKFSNRKDKINKLQPDRC